MRVAVFVLAALVFLAGLILDTSALLALAGEALWAHWRVVGIALVLIVGVLAAWRRGRQRQVPPTRAQPRDGAKRKAARPRKAKAAGKPGGGPRAPRGKSGSRKAKPAK
jgi:hypothetical protein